MDKIRIIGGQSLKGTIPIGGAKNAALPLMAAALLTQEPLVLKNIPSLVDIQTMALLLTQHGIQIDHKASQNQMSLQGKTIGNTVAPYDIVRKMRASILVLGPLLTRVGHACVSLPGGCAIGARPVDIHLKGLQALGAEITLEEGYIQARAPRGLRGARYTFPLTSVTGTANLMMAACLAEGTTELIHVAREPEVNNLAQFLNQMGAQIEGIGTDILTIKGVSRLCGATCSVMPDRIEMGTYAIAAAITGGDVLLKNADLSLLPTITPALEQVGVQLTQWPGGVVHVKTVQPLKNTDIVTEPFPGFATDLQAQIMSLLTLAKGASLITENIFENRFMHVPELIRMGADITIQGSSALVRGVAHLKGAQVMATDLRASVSLVLAALAAKGETIINRVYHLDRGYEKVEEKLFSCGAKIERISSRISRKKGREEQTQEELAPGVRRA